MSEELKFSQKFTSYMPKEQKVYPIQEHDWNKLKTMLENCNSSSSWSFKDVGLVLIGIGFSAFLSLIALYNSTDVEDWILITNWILFACTLIIGITLLLLDKDQIRKDQITVQQIMDEMNLIENKYQMPEPVPVVKIKKNDS